MNIKPLRSQRDYEQALIFIEAHWGAALRSGEGDKLDVLMTLVDAYEAEHFPIEAPDPVAAIEFRMEQGELSRKELESVLGSRSRVSEILNRKRRLTVNMIWNLHKAFNIPLESLSQPYEAERAAS